jgi:hypothetical protein
MAGAGDARKAARSLQEVGVSIGAARTQCGDAVGAPRTLGAWSDASLPSRFSGGDVAERHGILVTVARAILGRHAAVGRVVGLYGTLHELCHKQATEALIVALLHVTGFRRSSEATIIEAEQQ